MTPAVPDSLTAASLLPHRSRMLLVEQIVSLDDQQATTVSVANRNWPLFADGVIHAFVLVELVAQTAGVHNGLKRIRTHGPGEPARGWLVGIKQASFHVEAIIPGQSITARAQNAFVFEDLREITGTAHIGDKLAVEVTLQVIEANQTTGGP